MFRCIKKKEYSMSVDLEEPLTGQACSQLVVELIKYVMYQKQQIPLSYDSLVKLYSNSKPSDRNFSSMQNFVNSQCNVSTHLASQFSLDGCDVKEILIVIGATIVSPKLYIRLELPSEILCSKTHLDYQHSVRKNLMSVMRSMLQFSDFQEEMTVPIGPTNTFVLVHKKDPRKVSTFFIPKPQFVISSQNTASFHIKLNYSKSNLVSCKCKDLFMIHHDSVNDDQVRDDEEENILERTNSYDTEVPYQWYQSRDILKGFKFLR